MKKNDKKSNQRLKSIVLLLLVTGVVIGLVSSTAVKLASATYLMQKTQKPVITIPKIIEQFIDSVVPTTAPTTTKAPSSGGIQATTPPPTNNQNTTTEKPKPTQAPTTQAPTTQAPTTQGSTNPPTTVDPDAAVKADQANFNSYKTVVERAKVSNRAFTKTTNRTLSMSFFQSLAVSGAEDIVINDQKYFDNEVSTSGYAKNEKDLFINNPKACLLDAKDLEATREAVSSTKREELEDGSIKLVINFNDEDDPKPLRYEDTETEGFINAVFPVISAEQVRFHSDDQLGTDIESINLRYTGCYVELIYMPVSGEIISLKQVSNCVVEGKDGFKNVGGTITEVNQYVFD